jgi:hypothetical protein
MSIYEYRTVRIERAGWPRFSRSLFGTCSDQTIRSGGSVSALFAGVIGLAADEGVLMRAWPDREALANNAARTLTVEGLVESRVVVLEPTVRPIGTATPTEPGVYAHRWFWVRDEDQDEFIRLSEEGVWPFFEADGCEIIGLWREIARGAPVGLLLITRYVSVAHWERTRTQAPEPPAGADARLYELARQAVRRRAELTQRSIVRLTRLVRPESPRCQR